MVYSPPKTFQGLTIHHWNRGSGKDQYAKKNKKRFDLYEGILRAIRLIPNDEDILIVHRKPDGEMADIQSELRERLHGRMGLSFCTWGSHTATNEFVSCRHIILASVLQYNTPHNEGLGRSAKKLPTETRLIDADFDGTRLGEIAHHIYQAANRGAIRSLIGESCPPDCHLYMVFDTKQVPLDVLGRVFPGATIKDWVPVFRVSGNQQKLADLLEADATAEGITKPKRHYRERLGISKQSFSKLVNERLFDYLSVERGILANDRGRELDVSKPIGQPKSFSTTEIDGWVEVVPSIWVSPQVIQSPYKTPL